MQLFYELAVPDFAMRNESQAFEETLEELTLGESCGFRTAWLEAFREAGLDHLLCAGGLPSETVQASMRILAPRSHAALQGWMIRHG